MPSLRSQISRRFGRCWAEAHVTPSSQAMAINTLVMPGLGPGIHVFLSTAAGTLWAASKAWMAGTSPATTEESAVLIKRIMCLLVHAAVGHQGALELGALEIGAGQDGAGEARLGQISVLKISAGEVGAIEIGVGEIGALEVGLAQHRIEQAGIVEIGAF